MDKIVRLRFIEIEGFKNVGYGMISMPSVKGKETLCDVADILGIYGQNGSGKTAVVNVMEIIQQLLVGKKLPASVSERIQKDRPFCRIKVGFGIEGKDLRALVDYTVVIRRMDDSFEICEENIESTEAVDERFNRKGSLLHYEMDREAFLTPSYRYKDLVKGSDEKEIELRVAVKMANKEKKSVFFSEEGRAVFTDAENHATKAYRSILDALRNYAMWNLFVITSRQIAPISMNFFIPFSFKIEEENRFAKGEFLIRLDEPSVLAEGEVRLAKQIIENVNKVLINIIPGLSVKVYDHGKQMMDGGEEGFRIELYSEREGVRIPLRCESEGIIKIIAVLNVLVGIYHSPGMCLVIDELDAGVFEFLLGELMLVMSQEAKGQMIFTSHNLRILEMIDKRSLVFSTTNPMNRYITITNIKRNNNLRDVYLRSLTLGGQEESLYAETERSEIGKAFRKAGRSQD